MVNQTITHIRLCEFRPVATLKKPGDTPFALIFEDESDSVKLLALAICDAAERIDAGMIQAKPIKRFLMQRLFLRQYLIAIYGIDVHPTMFSS